MAIFLSILIVILGAFLIYQVYTAVSFDSLTMRTSRQAVESLIKKQEATLTKERNTSDLFDRLFKLSCDLGLYKCSEKSVSQYEYYAQRIGGKYFGIDLNYKMVYLLKAGIGYMYILIICILSLYNIGTILLLPVCFIITEIPTLIMDSVISDKDKVIDNNFHKIYSVFYYRIKHKQALSPKLSSIAQVYLPPRKKDGEADLAMYYNNPPECEEMLRKFIADCSVSEKVALQNMSSHYQIPNVQRMCILIQNRVEGGMDTTRSLDVFKKELEDAIDVINEEKLRAREQSVEKLIIILNMLIFEILLIWAYVQNFYQ